PPVPRRDPGRVLRRRRRRIGLADETGARTLLELAPFRVVEPRASALAVVDDVLARALDAKQDRPGPALRRDAVIAPAQVDLDLLRLRRVERPPEVGLAAGRPARSAPDLQLEVAVVAPPGLDQLGLVGQVDPDLAADVGVETLGRLRQPVAP